MFELLCTVRNCTKLLVRNEVGLGCEAGHHFDRAKGGYWNLTQPQDKKSLNPGDNDAAVLARHRFLERGHAAGLVERLKGWLPETGSPARVFKRVVDLGCGEGTFGPALFSGNAETYCGIDLSKKAIKLAARGWPEATWVLANADRGIPAADASVDVVMSLFGRRPAKEIFRVLKPSGELIVAVPGEDDLIELREHVQQEGRKRSRTEAIVEELKAASLQLQEQTQWKQQVQLGPEEIADALAMTYRAVRRSEQARVADMPSSSVTLSAELLRFKKA